MALRLGRRPPKRAPALKMARLFATPIPDHPAAVDYLARMSRWAMLGNDTYGDCVAVTWANIRRLLTAQLGGAEHYPNFADVEALYRTQNPNFPADDNGMEIQTCLEYLVHEGGPDGVKAIAFAAVDPKNLEEVKAALAIFGFIWTGCLVQRANMGQFNAGQPWDYIPGSPLDGGHSIISGGYSGVPTRDVTFVTWAAETAFTDAFWSQLVDEAWVVIFPEHLGQRAFLEGINVAQLAADYQALTGRELPLPTPIINADTTLAAAARVWASARHNGATKKVAKAIRDWIAAKNL